MKILRERYIKNTLVEEDEEVKDNVLPSVTINYNPEKVNVDVISETDDEDELDPVDFEDDFSYDDDFSMDTDNLIEARGRKSEDDEDDLTVWDAIYQELNKQSGYGWEQKRRLIPNSTFANAKRFNTDAQGQADVGLHDKTVSKDKATMKLTDYGFELNCDTEEKLKFAKLVADTYGLKLDMTTPEKSKLYVPDELLDMNFIEWRDNR